MITNWKVFIAAFGLMLLVACGGGGSPAAVTEEAPQATETLSDSQAADSDTPSTGTGERVEGGTLTRLSSDPPTLDPHQTTDATSASVIVEVFGGLVTISPELKVVPDLAESWDTPDGMVYTFKIREDAKFHDGKPVTAHDFKWSLERASDPLTGSPVVDQYLGDIVGVNEKLNGDRRDIPGIRVIDDHTLEITIDAPKSYFLAKLTYPTAFVLDRENVEADRRWFREPNGTGPFELADYQPGESMLLTRNDNYHLGKANLDEVQLILSGGTSMLMYETDEIHVTGVGIADLDIILDPGHPLNTQLHQAPPSFSTQYIGMNVNEPPFDDPKVRQAFNLAIDKEEIAAVVLADLVVPADGILPPGFPGYSADVTGYGYDPDRARELLAESKYGADLPRIFLTTAGGFGSSLTLDLEIIQEMWRENLGIEVFIQQTEFATYLQDLVRRRFQMFSIAWIADYPDPENYLDLLFYSDSSNNHTGYSSAGVDQLLEAARVETNEAERYQLYQQAEQIILDEAPWIPLWYSGEQHVLVKPYVHDYFLTQLIIPKLRFVYLTDS